MERSEPALVPEWLKGSNGGGGGGALHHFTSSAQSDDHGIAFPMRNRSSASDIDSPRSSAFVDRTTSSSYFRRSSSSNGSMVHHDKDHSAHSRSYSSFSRNHRDRDWDKEFDFREPERSLFGDHRTEKDSLRRSQSMISGKRSDVRKPKNGTVTNNSPLVGGSIVSSIHKAAFERDFPSLGTDEKQGVPDIGRVSSPVLSTAVQSLPIGTPSLIGGDGWTSALAEVPVMVGSNSNMLSSVQQTAPASSASASTSVTTGLNMAETLAQAPSRARTVPQTSVETQRLEELAIKQSRQLIPMTPSMPKTLVLNSSEKPKTKATRTGELSSVTKVGQQPSSSPLVNNSHRSGPAVPKTSQVGKLLVLKAARETNGISPTAREGLSPTNASRVANNSLGVTPSAAFAHSRSPNNPKTTADRKVAALSLTQNSSMDKRSTAQAQNRSDFFNSLRKKTSANLPAAMPDPNPVVSSLLDKSGEQIEDVAASVTSEVMVAPSSDSGLEWSSVNGSAVTGNCNDPCEQSKQFCSDVKKISVLDIVVDPDEEEAAFLRSLGWVENAGEEEEALTEEEINAFKEYMKLRPSSKPFRGRQPPK